MPEGEHLVEIGQAAVARAGTHVTVVAWTTLMHRSLEAAEQLAAEGISVEVIDPRGANPLDTDTILESVRRTGRLVIAHEAPKTGGAGAEVAALVAEHAIDYLAAPIVRVAGADVPIPQNTALERFVIPGTAEVVAAIRSVMSV